MEDPATLAICDQKVPKHTETGTLLWVLGTDSTPRRHTRQAPVIHAAWTVRRSSAEPVPAHLQTHHGGYITPPSAHRGGPPGRDVTTERVRKSIVRARSRCRTPVVQKNPEEEWIRSKLREEMAEDACTDMDLMGGKCSLLGRSRGIRCVDHGADRYENLADKGLSLQLGGKETRQRLDQRKRELREKQVIARMNESKKKAVKDVDNVAARRRAADILSDLHKRTLFAELARKREAQEHQHEVKIVVSHQAEKAPVVAAEETESPVSDSSRNGSKRLRGGQRLTMMPQQQQQKTEMVRVTVHGAKNLRPADVNGLADPFCVVEVVGKPGTKCHTQVVRRNLNPEWDESFIIKNLVDSDEMHFAVFDYDFDKNDCLGSAVLKGSRIIEAGVIEEDLGLEDSGNNRFIGRRNQAKINGYLSVTVAVLNSDGVTVRRADSFTRQLRLSFAGRMQAVREAISQRDEIAKPALGSVTE